MRNQHQRTRKFLQIIFQPLDRLDVQVVRRLVEQQHVRFAQQDLRQLDTHIPALRESLGRTLEILAAESESAQRPLGLHLRRLRTHHRQLVIDLRHLDDKVAVRLRFIVGALGDLARDGIQTVVQAVELLECTHRLGHHGPAPGMVHHLRQIPDAQVRRADDLPRSRDLQAHYEFEDGGFAGAVAAHKTDAVLIIDMETDMVQQRRPAEREGQVIDRNHTSSASLRQTRMLSI